MKQTAYSTYGTKAWRLFKSMFGERSEENYCRFAGLVWQSAAETAAAAAGPAALRDMVWDRDSVYADVYVEFLWRFRPVQHFFLAPGVARFCASSVREFSQDYCKRLPGCPPVEAPAPGAPPVFLSADAGGRPMMAGGFALHFPASERQRSVMVVPDFRIPVGSDRILLYYFAAGDGEDTVLMQCDSSLNPPAGALADEQSGAAELAKIIFGLSLYMDAFPETVVPAGAGDVKHIGHYEGQRRIVTGNGVVEEERRCGVSPHWRRGHFRLLSSDRFVRKQGLTVYVRGSFVKGTAFEVLDDAPARSSRWGGTPDAESPTRPAEAGSEAVNG